MHHASYLRLDHVMSLHRLFWVPEGTQPEQGVYVDYPANEFYAVLCLESQRHRTVLVGEDLGTVAPEVRPAMRKHGLLRTWVLQSSLRTRARDPLGSIPPHAVASINTHDMFPFAGFVTGADVAARLETSQLAARFAGREIRRRVQLLSSLADFLQGQGLLPLGERNDTATWLATNHRSWGLDRPDRQGADPGIPFARPAGTTELRVTGTQQPPVRATWSLDAQAKLTVAPVDLMSAALTYLTQSCAELVVLSLEDLWLETRPQNQPGTGSECPNWCLKAAFSLKDLEKSGALGARGDPSPVASGAAVIGASTEGTPSYG